MENEKKNQFSALAEKPVGSLLMQYAIPAIIAMAASSVYNIIDGIFIGQGVGAEAIMGLALTNPLMSLTAAFGAMVGVGAATLMSVKLGQKDYDTAKKILGNVIIMNVSFGLILGLLLLLFINPILRFFGASDVTLPYARNFMTVILLGNVVTHLYLGLNAMLRSTNRPQKAMIATIGTVVLNSIFLSLTRQLIFLVPAIFILPHIFNDPLEGLWYAGQRNNCANNKCPIEHGKHTVETLRTIIISGNWLHTLVQTDNNHHNKQNKSVADTKRTNSRITAICRQRTGHHSRYQAGTKINQKLWQSNQQTFTHNLDVQFNDTLI